MEDNIQASLDITDPKIIERARKNLINDVLNTPIDSDEDEFFDALEDEFDF